MADKMIRLDADLIDRVKVLAKRKNKGDRTRVYTIRGLVQEAIIELLNKQSKRS